MTTTIATEEIIEPDLPIVDPHHHLWFHPEPILAALARNESLTVQTLLPTFRRRARYFLEDFLADLGTGHNVRATVYVEVHSMYRSRGPEAMRSVGEIEFANGMAAMSASGLFGNVAVCAGIVGSVDLRLGDAARDVLEAQIRAGGGRYRGIRAAAVAYDADPTLLGGSGVPHLLLDPGFRAGFRHLESLGLSYDAWQLEYQLGELLDLAQAFPGTPIIVNHAGGLFGVGPYAGRSEERFASWRANIRALSQCRNVSMKLGGLGMPTCGFRWTSSPAGPGSAELAAAWRPYIESCIDAFGVERCMFESNYPIDAATASYPVLWNAFKRIVGGASAQEKTALFGGTATRIYRLGGDPHVSR